MAGANPLGGTKPFHHKLCMKTSYKVVPGVVLISLTIGCSEPETAAELMPPPAPMSLEATLETVIKPASNAPVVLPPPDANGAESVTAQAVNTRTGAQEFGLAPVTGKNGEVDLNALTAALQSYVADRMVPANSIKDLKILVDEKFLASLPAPPPGMKYVWDNRLQVTLASN